jgi:SP family general alpha glucoside:H+ symporter-like MFS transporter
MEDTKHVPAVHLDLDERAIAQAHSSAEQEKSMGFRTVMRLYYKAAFWSGILSFALVMEGYDLGIINSFWGQAAFLERFGQLNAEGKRYVPANWQAAVNNAALIGEIIGLIVGPDNAFVH